MIGHVYGTIRILSLDIVTGAVILLRFFCIQLNVHVSWRVYILLGITVWLIYTLDHIRDAEKAPQSKRARYVFHRKHKKILVIISTGLGVFIIPFIFFIPVEILLGGLFLGLLLLIYLLIQDKLASIFSKELYVALVYSLGILMVPTVIKKEFRFDMGLLLMLLSFANLILFSWFEEHEDSRDGFDSLATRLGKERLEKLILIVVSTGLAISILTFNELHTFFFVGFFIYSLMAVFPQWFRGDQRYRIFGDGIFLWPVVFEWL